MTYVCAAAITSPSSLPNANLEPFDIALPGSQPVFQHAVLLPALRAALSLNCDINPVSRFDRKHYFYHDQPAGYQITQYYHPFARDGYIMLNSADGLPEHETIKVGIKQVQLEQDTARSQEQDSETTLIDFNRSGHALIEVISLPHLHSPRAAAAYVRKVQGLLYAVDAVTTGMEEGGLRADVNVSVRRRGDRHGDFSYAGVEGLGQRTEIKNLGTFKGIEDAVKAERDRQIDILENGGRIEPETRGWSITQPRETRRLRGKEGEVDYRYMPDPDIPPLYIHTTLIDHLTRSLPPTPDQLMRMLTSDYGLSPLDAEALLTLDDGERMLYFQLVVRELLSLLKIPVPKSAAGKVVANWVLHELGALSSTDERPWTKDLVSVEGLAHILYYLSLRRITNSSAKDILKLKYNGDERTIPLIIDEEKLTFEDLSMAKYEEIAREVIEKNPKHVQDIKEKNKMGKIQFLMGQIMRHPDKGSMRPQEAEKVLRRLILGEK